MNIKAKLFSYDLIDSPIHRLSGVTKLICFLLLTFAVMYSYDIRVILFVVIFAIYILKLSRIQFSEIRLMVLYVLVFISINAVISFLFSPEEGVKIYGTRTVLIELPWKFDITKEQLLYSVTKLVKYASVVPFGIIFLLTTNPSEFASSLNRIGINYKVSYAVALTLRYFPDIQRDYVEISQAQQARGLELSKKASLSSRVKNGFLIIIPLIFSSLDRIEMISNGMDLRGFNKLKTRTWYTSRKMMRGDYLALLISAFIFIGAAFVSIFINKSRFWNPFI